MTLKRCPTILTGSTIEVCRRPYGHKGTHQFMSDEAMVKGIIEEMAPVIAQRQEFVDGMMAKLDEGLVGYERGLGPPKPPHPEAK